jgi:hypothetical protein
MKTDLNSRSSIFKRVKTVTNRDPRMTGTIEPSSIEQRSNHVVNGEIEDLLDRVNQAITDRDQDALPWLQLEIQARSLLLLRLMDRKITKFYDQLP